MSPLLTLADNGKPVHPCIRTAMMQTDSIPPPKVQPVEPVEKPVTEVIKEVPKARKQAIPVPVTLKVKPVIKVIKPQIVKPVIKILH
ncbi:MAG: hypothetical protein ABIN67_19910 [Ferruginibacter sp.]